MTFVLSGVLCGRTVQVTWQDGQLSGDPVAVAVALAAMRGLKGMAAGPPAGPYYDREYLVDPVTFYDLVDQYVFDGGTQAHQGDLVDGPSEDSGRGDSVPEATSEDVQGGTARKATDQNPCLTQGPVPRR